MDLQSAAITGGTLTTSGGGAIQSVDRGSVLRAATLSSGSTVTLLNNTSLTLAGTLANAGTVLLASVGNYTALRASGAVTLQGGTVQLSDNYENRITSDGSAATLTNAGVIQGTGRLGDGDGNLALVNRGTIAATGNGTLSVYTSGYTVTNTGLLEDTGTGGLQIFGTTVDNTGGGTILASGAGAHVDLQFATIIGGSLSTLNGGVIQTVDRGSVLRGASLGAGSGITVLNNTTLTLRDALSQAATVTLASAGNYTQLAIAGQTVLQAGSLVQMTDNFENRITSNGAAATLTNGGTIQGAGRLGDGDGNLSLVNQGTIDSTGASAILLDPAATPVINSGLLESTSAGGLLIVGATVDNTVGGTLAGAAGGTILASGAGAHVDLQSATIIGGTLANRNGGVIQTVDRGSVLRGASLGAGSTVTVLNNTTLTLRDALATSGTVLLNSAGNFTQLAASGVVTLQTGSLVQMTDNFENRITSDGHTATLTNAGTIQGAGRLGDGDGSLTFVNQGRVIATGGNAISLNLPSTTVTNTGLLEDTGAGGLLIYGTTVDGTGGGTILAAGAGAHVDLQSATIIGGTLGTSGGGVIQTVDRGSVLRGASLGAGSTVTVLNNTTLTLRDALATSGTVLLNSAGNFTQLAASGVVTLQTGSLVQMTDNFENRITSDGHAATLTNAGTIQGAGRLGDGDGNLTLINQGTIDATGANTLSLSTPGKTVTNTGLLEDTGAGGVLIFNTTVDDTAGGTASGAAAGTVLAAGAGAHVDLQTATIVGGTLSTSGGGAIQSVDRGSLLQGATISAGSTVTVLNNTSLTLAGTLSDAGTVLVASAGNYTALRASGAVTLQGGTVQLSDNFENRITSDGTASTLTNAGTIQGAGRLGDGDGNLAFVNQGVVSATGGNALTLNSPGAAVINTGTLQATGTGGLQVQGDMANNGLVWAAGGNVFLGGAITGSGQDRVTGAASLEFGGAVSSGQSVLFDAGATGTLALDSSTSFAGVIAGLARDGSNRLDLSDLGYGGATQANFSGTAAGGTLQVTDGGRTANLALAGNYVGTTVVLANDARGHVLLTLNGP